MKYNVQKVFPGGVLSVLRVGVVLKQKIILLQSIRIDTIVYRIRRSCFETFLLWYRMRMVILCFSGQI